MDETSWEGLRANTEIAVHSSGEHGVRLRGGPLDGWFVKKDAPSLAPDWHITWPPTVAAKHDPGRYELSESSTWAEWRPVEEEN